jgi:DNA-binding NarL/FixJ family response regulator
MKILVVDDHPLIREALKQVLSTLDTGIQVLEAQSAKEGFVVSEAHPDLHLILLDLGLPGEDGMEALPLFRERAPQVPVVVFSASDHPDVVKRAIDAGAMGFIPKTSSNALLVNALRFVLAGGVYLPLEVLRQPSSESGGFAGSAPVGSSGLRDLGLTQRQAQVLALLVQGKSNKLICRELNLAEGTVKVHVAAVLKTLGVANRTQAVLAVSRLGIKLPQLAWTTRSGS